MCIRCTFNNLHMHTCVNISIELSPKATLKWCYTGEQDAGANREDRFGLLGTSFTTHNHDSEQSVSFISLSLSGVLNFIWSASFFYEKKSLSATLEIFLLLKESATQLNLRKLPTDSCPELIRWQKSSTINLFRSSYIILGLNSFSCISFNFHLRDWANLFSCKEEQNAVGPD